MSCFCYKTQIGLSTKNYLKSSKGKKINESQFQNMKYTDYKIARRNYVNEEKEIPVLQGQRYRTDSRPSTNFQKKRRSCAENQSTKNINSVEFSQSKIKARRTPSHQCRNEISDFEKNNPKAPLSFIKKFEEQQFDLSHELQTNFAEPFKTLNKFPSMNSQKTKVQNFSKDHFFNRVEINYSHNVLGLDKAKLVAPYRATPESHDQV